MINLCVYASWGNDDIKETSVEVFQNVGCLHFALCQFKNKIMLLQKLLRENKTSPNDRWCVHPFHGKEWVNFIDRTFRMLHIPFGLPCDSQFAGRVLSVPFFNSGCIILVVGRPVKTLLFSSALKDNNIP